MAGEKRNDDPPARFGKNIVERFAYDLFRLRMPFAFRIGGIRQKKANALFPRKTTQGGQVGAHAVRGEFVDLEIAAVHDLPRRGFHRQRIALRDGVADGDKVETQAAELQRMFRGHGDQLHPVEQAALAQLVLHKGQRQGGTVNLQPLDEGNQPGHRADVVFMAVRQDHAEQPLALIEDGFQRRDDHVHPKLLIVGEHDPAVDEDTALGRVPHLAVHAYFAKAPEGRDGQKSIRHYALCA